MSGVLTDGGSSPIPLKPDGQPDLAPGSPVPVNGGAFSLYDVPQELTDYLAAQSNGKLLLDIGHKVVTTHTHGIAGGVPGLIGATGTDPNAPVFGSANSAEHSMDDTAKHREAYNIYKSPVQVMKNIQALSYNDPLQFLAIQKALASGSWGNVYLNGTFDPATEHALGIAMLQYAKLSMGTGTYPTFTYTDPDTGKPKTVGGFMAYLMNTAQTVQRLGGDGSSIDSGNGTNPPPPIQLTDPAALQKAAQNAAQTALGRGLTDDELQQFVAAFHSAETTFQTTDKGSITAPDPLADAAKFAQDEHPKAYRRNQEQNYMNAFINMFAPSGSQRPDAQESVPDL